MNFAKNYKGQFILAALGLLLLLAARANSQEIVNTDFAAPSTSVGGNFNTPTTADLNTKAAAIPQIVYTPANAMAIRANNDMRQLNVPRLPWGVGMFTSIAVLLLCCAAVKKVASGRREDPRANWDASPARAKMLPSQKPQPIHS